MGLGECSWEAETQMAHAVNEFPLTAELQS